MVVFAVETGPASAAPGMTAHRPAAAASAITVDRRFLTIGLPDRKLDFVPKGTIIAGAATQW